MVAFLVLPMLIMLRYSFNVYVPGGLMKVTLSLVNYRQFFSDPYFQHVLGTTVWVAALCTIVSLVLAFPVAYVIARADQRYKAALLILVVFPLLVGNVVRAAGWMALFGTTGALNAVLLWLHLLRAPLHVMYTTTAVIVGIIAVVTPYMIIALQSVLEGIDVKLEEAALNLGASGWSTFWRVTLPLAMPGVVAGTSLVFILCMNAYATPFLLGGPSFKMMAQAIYDQIQSSQNWPFGAALAFILMVATVILTVASQAVLSRRSKAAHSA